jgi:hypothetical protein
LNNFEKKIKEDEKKEYSSDSWCWIHTDSDIRSGINYSWNLATKEPNVLTSI